MGDVFLEHRSPLSAAVEVGLRIDPVGLLNLVVHVAWVLAQQGPAFE